MFSDDFLLLSDSHPQFSYGLPPLELGDVTKPAPTVQEICQDKRMLTNLNDALKEDPVAEPLRLFLTKSIECASCTLEMAPRDFPLRQGTCGHTICRLCYETHVRHPRGEWFDAKCPACKRSSFQGLGGINRVAMLATYYLGEVRRRFESEIRHVHSNWKSHVSILEKRHPPDNRLEEELTRLRGLVNERDEALEGLRDEHKKRVREMREHLSFTEDRAEEIEKELRRTNKILCHLEKGRRYYYFLCPKCKNHVEKIKRSKITNSLPTVQTSESVRPGLEVDDSAFLSCLTTRSELRITAGFKAMRAHLINHCVPLEIGGRAKESELPVFYRQSSAPAKGTFTLPPRKKRKVSLEGETLTAE